MPTLFNINIKLTSFPFSNCYCFSNLIDNYIQFLTCSKSDISISRRVYLFIRVNSDNMQKCCFTRFITNVDRRFDSKIYKCAITNIWLPTDIFFNCEQQYLMLFCLIVELYLIKRICSTTWDYRFFTFSLFYSLGLIKNSFFLRWKHCGKLRTRYWHNHSLKRPRKRPRQCSIKCQSSSCFLRKLAAT